MNSPKITNVQIANVMTGGYLVVVEFDDKRAIAWPWVEPGMLVAPIFEQPSNEDVVQAMHDAVRVVRWHDEVRAVCTSSGGVA